MQVFKNNLLKDSNYAANIEKVVIERLGVDEQSNYKC